VEARELKLVPGAHGRPPRPGRRRGVPVALGLLVLAAALAATWLGADRARRKIEVGRLAEEALRTALERGSADPEVHATLVDLRRVLGWRPLESKTRVVYASLVLGLATHREDMRLAAFHAERAAALAPVTVPVVRAAALVLANTGDRDRSLELVRSMFGYDPARAAATLAQIESLVLGVRLDEGIPETPDAWTAWSRQLRSDGRRDEAGEWLRRTHARWPAHLPAWVAMARNAYSRRDWAALESLLPAGRPLPMEPEAAALHIWRAHLVLRRGEREEALARVETALSLTGSGGVRTLAGDLFDRAGDWARARREWSRALHSTSRARTSTRRALLLRLARLEDRHGRPGAALRLWESVLEIDPDHVEARRRVDDLSGFQR
jgi:tetratricopeptide (TPR) repeat protein